MTEAAPPATPPPARVLDLRGVACPLNYVRVRVALDTVEPGGTVEAWVDPGEPGENVPRSCEEDGFPVLLVAPPVDPGDGRGAYVRVLVERPGRP